MAESDALPDFAEVEPERLAALLAQGQVNASSATGDAPAQPTDAGRSTDAYEADGVVPGGQALLIPGYSVEREIHRGGQGVVYLATQESTRRQVAIKVLRGGPFATSAERSRLQREVEVLAQLNSPHIVTIHDSGTVAGCSYFVMQYVPGLPLDKWIAARNTPLPQALSLFIAVCDAVNAAHLHGVIHRDLKPSNILVDSAGQPHLLDFGLAKSVQEQAELEVAGRGATVVGQFLGTLPWASPEQVEGALGRIDLRTDVYSLGVILYQVLTGRFPYEYADNLPDAIQSLLTDKPVRPRAIRKDLDDDLETIVLKCLESEPERRYQSAGELARDIRHYLAGEPIEARRDSFIYILSKHSRRYRAWVAAAAVFLLVVLVGLVATSSLWVLAEQRGDNLQRADYQNRIALASAALDARELDRMRELLEGCPDKMRGWEWRYLYGASDLSECVLHGHTRWVAGVALGPNGRCVASVSFDGTLCIWDAESRAAMPPIRVSDKALTSVAFLPDGRRLVSFGDDRMLRFWDVDMARQEAKEARPAVTLPEASYSHLAVSPDGRVMAAPSVHGVLLWQEGVGLQECACYSGLHGINCLTFSPDGRVLLGGDSGGLLHMWDVATRQEFGSPLQVHDGPIRAITHCPDRNRRVVMTGGMDGHLKRVDLDALPDDPARVMVFSGQHTGEVLCIVYDPAGTYVASGGADRTIRRWDAKTGTEIATFWGHGGPVKSIVFRADGREIWSASDDHTLRVWSVHMPPEPRFITEPAYTRSVTDLAFSADSRQLASAGDEGTLSVWDLVGETRVARRFEGHEGQVRCVAWSPDGTQLASGGPDQTLRIWNVATGLPAGPPLRGHVGEVRDVMWSADGRQVVSAGADGTLHVWDIQNKPELSQVVAAHADGVNCLALSPDGRNLVSGAEDDAIIVWAWEAGRLVACLQPPVEHNAAIRSVAFSSDGNWIASGDNDGVTIVWNARTGRKSPARIGRLAGNVLSVAFSPPDNARIVTAGWDHTMRFWDVGTGAEILALHGHVLGVRAVAFSPDGLRMASGDGAGVIKVWTVRPCPVHVDAVEGR